MKQSGRTKLGEKRKNETQMKKLFTLHVKLFPSPTSRDGFTADDMAIYHQEPLLRTFLWSTIHLQATHHEILGFTLVIFQFH